MKQVAATAFMTLLVAQTASADCATRTELQSLDMRALQSELMVSALACGKKNDYNQYVANFSSDLRWQGGQLKGYFARMHGGRSEYELNRFVTQMANQASRLSLNKSSAKYCQHATKLFNRINHSMPWQIIDYANDRYNAWHNILPCDKQQVVAAAE